MPYDSARGQKRSELMHAVDFLPTLSHLAGTDTSKLPDGLDGLNVWDTIVSGEKLNRTELPLQIAINRDLDRVGGDVPCLGSHCKNINYTALIQWPYKIILGNPFVKLGGNRSERSRWYFFYLENSHSHLFNRLQNHTILTNLQLRVTGRSRITNTWSLPNCLTPWTFVSTTWRRMRRSLRISLRNFQTLWNE